MYAITFDLDTQTLEASYGNASWREIPTPTSATPSGSTGSTGNRAASISAMRRVNAITCVLAAQD